jgi:hypothetical protein
VVAFAVDFAQAEFGGWGDFVEGGEEGDGFLVGVSIGAMGSDGDGVVGGGWDRQWTR